MITIASRGRLKERWGLVLLVFLISILNPSSGRKFGASTRARVIDGTSHAHIRPARDRSRENCRHTSGKDHGLRSTGCLNASRTGPSSPESTNGELWP
jgi:hypothetical protein